MRTLRSYSTEEVMGLPAQQWVDATEHQMQVRELEREMTLMFPEREMLRAVDARNTAENTASLYEKALQLIAGAAGRQFKGREELGLPAADPSRWSGEPGQLEALVRQVAVELAALREMKHKMKQKRKVKK